MTVVSDLRERVRGREQVAAVDAREPWPWRIPGGLSRHAVALAIVLFALLTMLDNGTMITADEGALLSQAQIARSGNWGMANPMPTVDPSGKWFGIESSDLVGGRFFPYAKHATYPAVMSPLLSLGGLRLVLAASVAATVAAAVLAALLARRFSRHLDIATLWIVGLASPLFFDGYMVAAHSIGAALAVLAVYSIVCWWNARSWSWLAGSAVGLSGAVLFRSEGMLLGVALAATIGVIALLRRDRVAVLVGGVIGALTVATWWLDGVIHSHIVGGAQVAYVVDDNVTPWLEGRADGAYASLLRPQLAGVSTRGILLFGVIAAAVLGAFYARHRPTERIIIRGAASAVVVGSLLIALFQASPIPGLLIAFPLLTVGLATLGSAQFRSLHAQIVAGTAVVYTAGIIATQYSIGGGMEWGGRFFHMILPLVVPLVLAALGSAHQQLDRVTARASAVSLAAITIVVFVISVGTILRIHDITAELVDRVHEVSATTASARDPRGPIVASNLPSLGRFAWRDAVRSRYLMVPSSDLVELDARLADDGVDDFVFAAAHDGAHDVASLTHFAPDVSRTVTVGDWQLYVMRRARPTP